MSKGPDEKITFFYFSVSKLGGMRWVGYMELPCQGIERERTPHSPEEYVFEIWHEIILTACIYVLANAG